MSSGSSCPAPDRLERALNGVSDHDEAEAVVEHLASCAACLEAAPQSEAPDPLLRALRSQSRLAAQLDGDREQIDRVVRRATQFIHAVLEATRTSKSALEVTVDPTPTNDDFEADSYDFLAPAQAADELGRLGNYRVIKVLGEGGMGVVFEAEDPLLHRRVALKAMKPRLAASGDSRRRFLREAQTAASVEHENIVTIHQVGDDCGIPFIAMPLLRGESLADRMARAAETESPKSEVESPESRVQSPKSKVQSPKSSGALPLADVVRIGREIAAGLAAANECGLIHRDIKPANVWLEAKTGRVKLLDFGLARAAAKEQHLTQTGVVLGTPSYMAPEQARGLHVDHRSDLFSLGCVLYHMAAGRLPFTGTDTLSKLLAVTTETPAPPAALNPDIPAPLDQLIRELLAKPPTDRPQTAQEVVDRLAEIERGRVGPGSSRAPAHQAREGGREGEKKRGGRRFRLVIGLAAAGAALALLAGVLIVMKDRDHSPDKALAANASKTLSSPAALPDIDWSPGPAEDALPGIVPRPAKLPGIGRWQVATRVPRGVQWGGQGLAYSRDGRWFGSVDDTALRIYDASTRQHEAVLLGHAGAVRCIAWSGDSDRLATAGYIDGDVRVWSISQRKSVAVWPAHSEGVGCLAWSRDGRLASGSRRAADGRVRLWTPTGEPKGVVDYGHYHYVESLAWSPDGQQLAIAGGGTNLLITDADGKRERTFEVGPSHCVAFSDDGQWLACGGDDGVVHVWNTPDWSELPTGQRQRDSAVVAVAFSHDSKSLADATIGGRATISGLGGSEGVSAHLPTGAIAWSPDDATLAICDRGGNIRFRNRALGQSGPELPGVNAFVSLGPDGVCFAALGSLSSTLRITDGDRANSVTIAHHIVPFSPGSMDWSPDGGLVAAIHYGTGGTCTLFDAGAGAVRNEWTAAERGYMRFSPDGKRLATAGSDRVVCVWSLDGRRLAESEKLSDKASALAWTPDGARLAVALDGAKRIDLLEVADSAALRIVQTRDVSLGRVVDLAWSPDASQLAAASYAGVFLFNGADDPPLALKAAADLGWMASVAWSPDGQRLIAGSRTYNAAQLWTRQGEPGVFLSGLDGVLGDVAFVAEGREVVTASRIGGIMKWNAASGEALQAMALLPNDQLIVFGPGGDVRHATPRADDELVYLIEKESGEQEMLTPAEFRQRIEAARLAWSTTGIAPPPHAQN